MKFAWVDFKLRLLSVHRPAQGRETGSVPRLRGFSQPISPANSNHLYKTLSLKNA